MKKSILLSAIMAGALFTTTANAQIGVSLGLHFGGNRGPVGNVVVSAPVYTEPVVYDNYADDYYYLPDVGAYYSVSERAYYYDNGGRWMSAAYLPGYRNYDWRTARRFEVHARRPYLNHEYYRSRYEGNRGGWNNDSRGFNNRPDVRRNENFDNRGSQRFDNRDNNSRGPQGGFDRGRGNNQPQPQQGGRFNQPQQNPQPTQGGRERGNNGGGTQRFSDNQSQNGQHRFNRS